MFRCIEPQDHQAELAPHPHRLTLRGQAGSAAFPPLCPHCGEPAANTIACSKVFRRVNVDGATDYVVETVQVPFCDTCIDRHRAQQLRPSPFDLMCSSFATMDMLGAVFPAMAVIFVLHLALNDVWHGRVTRAGVELGIAAAFALIAWIHGRGVWEQSERFRVPPQTEISRAFDFSEAGSALFEGKRFVCTMRDERFAQAFQGMNAEREWNPQSTEAIAEHRRSNRLTWAFGLAIGAFGLWEMLRDLFS